VKILVLWVLFFIAGCVSKPTVNTESVSTHSNSVLFLNGVYKQDVHVEFKETIVTEQADFKTILKKSDEEIQMFCYVGFGIPLFKIKDNLKDPFEMTISDPRIKKNEELFRKLYPVIKEFLLMKKTDSRLSSPKMKFFTSESRFPLDVLILDWERDKSPVKYRFESRNHFNFQITTTDYSSK
jgi:hypothetical protein